MLVASHQRAAVLVAEKAVDNQNGLVDFRKIHLQSGCFEEIIFAGCGKKAVACCTTVGTQSVAADIYKIYFSFFSLAVKECGSLEGVCSAYSAAGKNYGACRTFFFLI